MQYLDKYSGPNFDPHITIGFEDFGEHDPLDFQTKRISIYQLGPYCTCKKIIF